MTLREKIKGFMLLGKRVVFNPVEQPNVGGMLYSIDSGGWCKISGYPGSPHISKIKRESSN